MKIMIERDRERAYLSLRGDLDAFMRDAFVAAVGTFIEEGARVLFVDMLRVRYLTSSGVRALLALQRRLQDLGGSLTIVRASKNVAATLQLLNVEQRLMPYHIRSQGVFVRGLPTVSRKRWREGSQPKVVIDSSS